MNFLPRLAHRIFNTPLLIERGKLDVILAVLSPRIGIEPPEVDPARLQEQAEKRQLLSQDGAIAVIDINGALVNRAAGMDAMSGMTSYDDIAQAVEMAAADETVSGIMLRIQSPGGEAAGITSLADLISAVKKPVWAAIDDYAFSAAQWIASAADRVYITETGGAGSIGVIAIHVDMSALNEKAGIKVTPITYGARKNDFSSDFPLSEEAFQRGQADVNALGELFVAAVAANRGLSRKAIRSMEANTFLGQQAIDAGLADKLGDFRTAMSDMARSIAKGNREEAPAVITPRRTEDTRGLPSDERRSVAGELRVEGSKEEPRILGHVAVFDQWSMDLGGFVERVAPGAFAKTLREQDIHHYFNHDGNVVLGRNRSGTAIFTEDSRGLHVENYPPDTQLIRDMVIEPIRRGDVDQGSFAFHAVRQEWGKQDGELTRTLHEVRLYHTAVLPRGAYSQTDVGLRGFAAASGLDFYALAVVDAKCKQGIPLNESEMLTLKEMIAALQLLTVAPEPAAVHHPTETKATPLVEMQALRRRLMIAERVGIY